jgi:hypothetical protein
VDDTEYSTYHAAQPIDIDGVRRYNPGDVVPKSDVDNGFIPEACVVGQGEYTPQSDIPVNVVTWAGSLAQGLMAEEIPPPVTEAEPIQEESPIVATYPVSGEG